MMHQCIFVFIFTYFALIANIRGLDSEFSDSQASLDNLDADLTPLQIIKKYGYPSEAHAVETTDGYILELHRIPYGKAGPGNKKKVPVFLHHGLLGSSMHWVINGPNKSLGYRLADAGYDVWMANARGNTFSRKHVEYNPYQKEFWNYSFHEIALYDLPAAIDHILETTEEKQLIYIGYSMGTAVFYAMASTLTEYQEKIKFQISLGPVSAIPHSNSAARSLISYMNQIDKLAGLYSNGAFMERDLTMKNFGPFFCGPGTSNNENYCKKYIFFSVFGESPEQFDDNLLPVISNNFPAGTSCKNMIHFSQLISSGTFAQFNYEEDENMRKYGSATPPEYNIDKIRVPMRLYYSDNDLLSTPLDTKLFYQKIAKPLGLKRVNLDKFNHIDFLWAKDINRLLNDEIIKFINNSTNHNSNNGSSNFIQNTITEALDTRKNTPVPVNVPFDEESFSNNIGKDFLANVYKNFIQAIFGTLLKGWTMKK
ncbi:gastric triacylglycerol lipase-like [Planococcus citri]|uniref:gastric triacylglycerol lipase-like n=1 Tax=Planococcus citri TaxID=170843 RepID=UPI0031F8F521